SVFLDVVRVSGLWSQYGHRGICVERQLGQGSGRKRRQGRDVVDVGCQLPHTDTRVDDRLRKINDGLSDLIGSESTLHQELVPEHAAPQTQDVLAISQIG